jgi:hypothetical protein
VIMLLGVCCVAEENSKPEDVQQQCYLMHQHAVGQCCSVCKPQILALTLPRCYTPARFATLLLLLLLSPLLLPYVTLC